MYTCVSQYLHKFWWTYIHIDKQRWGGGGGFGSMNMFEEMVAQNQDTTGQPKGKMNCMVGRLRCVACLWGCLPK